MTVIKKVKFYQFLFVQPNLISKKLNMQFDSDRINCIRAIAQTNLKNVVLTKTRLKIK